MVVDDDDVLDSEDYYIFDRMKQFVLSDQVGHLPAAKQTLVWIDRAVSYTPALLSVLIASDILL